MFHGCKRKCFSSICVNLMEMKWGAGVGDAMNLNFAIPNAIIAFLNLFYHSMLKEKNVIKIVCHKQERKKERNQEWCDKTNL